MLPVFLLSIAALFFKFSAASVTVLPAGGDAVCVGQVTESETFIGQDKNVKVQQVTCPDVRIQSRVLGARQNTSDVCGNTCGTNCFTPAGGGPVPNDCHIIADALRFDSQNIGALFTIGTGTNNTIVMQFSSCLTFFVNQTFLRLNIAAQIGYLPLGSVQICIPDHRVFLQASLIDFVAPNCQSTQNAHGGNCVATDQRWFVHLSLLMHVWRRDAVTCCGETLTWEHLLRNDSESTRGVETAVDKAGKADKRHGPLPEDRLNIMFNLALSSHGARGIIRRRAGWINESHHIGAMFFAWVGEDICDSGWWLNESCDVTYDSDGALQIQ
ncbi:hypothetical protein DFH09DRAFT_1493155 [Mycena vulgaris]|nr:hypothetical protein DFH09DRAFT_1493155 [Mycena vulgaris]